MKRLLSMLLTVGLIIGLVPAALVGTAHAATGTYFIFPNEKYDADSARVVNTDRVTVNGTINGVNGSTISYSVFQLSKNGTTYTEVNKNESQKGGITVTGSTLKITDIKLFPGLNRITFQSSQNSADMKDSIYIEYQDGPKLYDLSATLNGETEQLIENQTTVLTDAKNSGTDDVKVVIQGTAPNADNVTLTSAKSSNTYTVNSYTGYKLTGSVVLSPGKNVVTIKVGNGTQALTVTREITIYTGKPEFSDLNLNKDGNVSTDLTTSPDFTVADTSGIVLKGKVLVPGGASDPKVATINARFIDVSNNGSAVGSTSGVDATIDTANVTTSNGYRVYPFQVNVPTDAVIDHVTGAFLGLTFDDSSTPPAAYPVQFTLRSSTQPYIDDVNYLSDFNVQLLNRINGSGSDQTTAIAEAQKLSGNSMKNKTTDAPSVPVGLEFIVVNGAPTSISELSGVTVHTVGSPQDVVRTINGKSTQVKKIVAYIDSLPKEGANVLNFYLNGDSTKLIKATVNLLQGPFMKYDTIYDGQQIPLNTSSANLNTYKLTQLGYFKGKLLDVSNASDIHYTGSNRNVFLYVNNVLVDLNGTGVDFKLASSSEDAAANALANGNNEIKFVYKPGIEYANTVKVNFTQTNIPVIPVANTQGIIPFTPVSGLSSAPKYSEIAPKSKDANFKKVDDTNYTTSLKNINVFGTFSIADLGTANQVPSALSDITNKDQYILEIKGSDGSEVNWTLNNQFYSAEDAKTVYNSGSTTDKFNSKDLKDLLVYYHPDKKYFSFVLKNQTIPQDGTAVAYNITLYNSGKSGPFATFRLQVSGQSTSFDILRPLPEKRIVNQNFVQVVVNAGNADSVMVGKETAVQEGFDSDYDGTIDYPLTYKAIVTGLKPNKDNKIDVVVTVGKDKQKQTITVKYVPTNIPGEQFMEAMKTSHKVFDGNLTLAFAKGTSLIRRDYDQPQQFKNQVFSGHTLYFAIANSEDGVVDRHEFETEKALSDMQSLIADGSKYFNRDFPDRYTKSSPVFWIDPGVADDIKTDAYDPVTYGADPYQLANKSQNDSSKIKNFYWRDPANELVPSKRATLTLTYDSSIAQDAGKQMTVFYFDSDLKDWQNIGGVVDPKKHTIKVPFDRFGYYVVAKVGETYSDVIKHKYARDYIEAILAKGVMNPIDPINSFGPDSYIKRGEFTTMMVKGLQIPLNYSGAKHFDDVSVSNAMSADALYDYRYIETAARAGIVKGSQPRIFMPEDVITRQDAAVIIAKALNLKLETDHDKIMKNLSKTFKDADKIDYYAQASVLAIAKKGFITGSPVDASDPKKGYMFNPTSLTLRGDAAIIVAKVMADKKLLPKI
ncbi:S-layer homology domain-containing protein [Paenibacillus sp. 23TSA30-6]|uniref:S-layer homology domain-containing protein n=1 Tax=Paenibacillus sp. 23TSA30-6 TaxID=2546104 RepID=UPI0017889252|nr:S-layer homology domain-containing protein [Paenibacillus sp. 23TSA30-6]MBE0337519.1 amylopullulanase alpha-amylase/pullulanase [Paenibacillus sp. 23TSA30-6]